LQNVLKEGIDFKVYKVQTPLALSKNTAIEALTLIDLNKHFNPSWVKEYKSISIELTVGSQSKTFFGKNDTLTSEQKKILTKVDNGFPVTVRVKYIPQNSMAYNDVKEYEFTTYLDPENEAKFGSGVAALDQYIKKNISVKIPAHLMDPKDVAVVKFTIDEIGRLSKVYLVQPTKFDDVDKVILDAITEMPNWSPASYSNGVKVVQECALVIGNLQNCLINLINVETDL
jgi:hypothetical protein